MERVASQLNKTDPHAANKEMRTFGTLGVLRHEVESRAAIQFIQWLENPLHQETPRLFNED